MAPAQASHRVEPAYVVPNHLAESDPAFASVFNSMAVPPPPGLGGQWHAQIGDVLKATASFDVSCESMYGGSEVKDVWLQAQCLYFAQAQQFELQRYSQEYASRAVRRKKRYSPLVLATQLKELEKVDPEHVMIVRKINRLGFDSAKILRAHYENFGPISEILLSNAREKEDGAKGVRLRPSGIGFVVFENAKDAERALAEGETQIVESAEIMVTAFQRRRSDSTSTTVDSPVDSDDA